jgi:hypothetical protein
MSDESQQKNRRQKFSSDEDGRLRQLVQTYGEDNWHAIANEMENRRPRQCKERWMKYLRPEIAQREWTSEDDQLLEQKVREIGSRWKTIAQYFPGRADVSLKNRYNKMNRRWNMCIKRMLNIPLKQRRPKQSKGVFEKIDWPYDNETFDWNPDSDETVGL